MSPLETTSKPSSRRPGLWRGSLASALCAGALLLSTSAAHATTLTVTTTADSGIGSLRWALDASNAFPGLDTIQFAIGSGIQSIQPTTPLPVATDAVLLDATTQPGYSGRPLIELSGQQSPKTNGATGLVIAGGDSLVKGLSFTGWDAFNGRALQIVGGDPFATNPPGTALKNNSRIEGCSFGIRPDLSPLSNVSGVEVLNSQNNVIGGLGTAARCYFGGAQSTGIRITGAWVRGNMVLNNWIGLRPDGESARVLYEGRWISANATGIQINGGTGNVVGGDSQDARNVIVDASTAGVQLAFTASARVAGNYIGTSGAGITTSGQNGIGVDVWASPDCVIGASGADGRNTIAGQSVAGVQLRDAQTQRTRVQNNLIGTSIGGDRALPNAVGVLITGGAQNNIIGGQGDRDTRNIISGNTGAGVLIESANNQVQGNRIGTDFFGALALGNGTGVLLRGAATANTIGGESILTRNIISGNKGDGVTIQGSEAKGNRVASNFLGVDLDGQKALGNGGSGIVCEAPDTVIGGLTASPGSGAGNVIAANAGWGVHLANLAGNCDVQGNVIGTNAYGYAALANGKDGVQVSSTTRNASNRIGGTDVQARNLISGNTGAGVHLTGYFTDGEFVLNNFIGTNLGGTTALANAGGGVKTSDYASAQRIGQPGAGNVISGNGVAGVILSGLSQSNYVAANRIGTTADGTTALGNAGPGVLVKDQSGFNIIGTNVEGGGNVISGNASDGIRIDGEKPRDPNQTLIFISNVVLNNRIGLVAVDGSANNNAIPNNGAGVRILNAKYNQVGAGFDSANQQAPFRANKIQFNTGPGVWISGDGAYGHEVSGNVILGNAKAPIEIFEFGNDANDAGDGDEGPNNKQNFPVIARVLSTSTTITLSGTLDSKPSAKFSIDFYRNGAPPANGRGEAAEFLGRQSVQTDAAGRATFSLTVNRVPGANDYFSATATNEQLSTSAMGPSHGMPEQIAPTVTIAQPTSNGTYLYELLRGATGTAQDNPGGSGLEGVKVELLRYVQGTRPAGYWNGTNWVATSSNDTLLPAVQNGANWSFAFPTAAQGFGGGRFALRALANDNDGNQTSSALIAFAVGAPDVTAPTISIAAPVTGNSLFGVETATGTAQDNAGGVGLQSVSVRLFRAAGTGVVAGYWNAQSKLWQAAEVENDATLSGSNWTFAMPTAAQGFVPASYTLRATAKDVGTNTAFAQSAFTLIRDTTAPVVKIVAPTLNSNPQTLATATGTATDVNGSGVARVTFRLYREGYGSLTGGVWNAQNGTWTGAATENPAVLNGDNWTYTLPTAAQGFVPARYSINAYAYDRSGNRATTPTVNFVLGTPDRTQPRVSVNTPFNNTTYRDLRAFSGTASDAGGSGLKDVRVVLYRPAQGNLGDGYWDGTGFTKPLSEIHYRAAIVRGVNWTFAAPTAAQGFANARFQMWAVARDGGGGSSTTSAVSFTLSATTPIDSTAPTLTMTTPAANTFYNRSFAATGTVADNVGGLGVARVQVVFFRYGGGTVAPAYWNGTFGWTPQLTSDSFLPASILANGNWNCSLPINTTLAGPGRYGAYAITHDKAGNTSTIAMRSFVFDPTYPTATLAAPISGAQANVPQANVPQANVPQANVPQAKGTCTDPLAADGTASGIASVQVQVYRYSQTGRPEGYWQGGNIWSTTSTPATWRLATISGTNWALVLPTAAQGAGPGRYLLRVTVTDRAGNPTVLTPVNYTIAASATTTISPSGAYS